MAAFFHGGSEARQASSSSSEFALQQQQRSLLLMNPLGHALLHAPPSLAVDPTTVDMSTCTPYHLHNNNNNNNSCFVSAVDSDPTRDVINPAPGGSHEFELLRRPPLAVVSPGNGKKLSLSLSQTQTQIQTRTQTTIDQVEQGNSPVSTVTNGVVFGPVGNGLDPRYLKAAQELLDEIVSVGNAKKSDSDASKGKLKVKTEFSGGGRNLPVGELTAAYRQELQMKEAKLVSMVEEVEQRYRHYREQMEALVSSFEQAAGFGAAKPYTSLALQTISEQFRCLKDAIRSQIKLISKCLGEECGISSVREGYKSLRFVDQTQLRRHLGINMQHLHHHHANAWRPQRGLPERAVSILRAWLFEHFLHPYPKDLDKQMLAKQTGLTRSQVSNWFINARVRLWKPMVEEMYLEEMKGQENAKDNNNNINGDDNDLELEGSSSRQRSNNASDTLIPENSNLYNNKASDRCSSSIVSTNCLVAASHHGGVFSPQKRLRATENDVVTQISSSTIVSFDVERRQQIDHAAREANSLIHFDGGFGNYHQAMYNGNAVSLSLGLPPSRDQTFDNVPFGTSHQIEFSGVSPSSTFQNIDKKRFVANAVPLLPDFFA